MRTREEYYDQVLKNRSLASNPAVTACTCPNTLCDWHGKCRECVALHRHHGDHVPVCLQPILAGKLQALAGTAELRAVPREGTPQEYRHYVKERDKETEE